MLVSVVVTHLRDALFSVDIELPDASAATEQVFELPFHIGVVRRHQSYKSAGSAAKLNSYLSNASGARTGLAVQLEADPIGGGVNDTVDVSPGVLVRGAPTGRQTSKFWFLPLPAGAAGADNDIHATFLIERHG